MEMRGIEPLSGTVCEDDVYERIRFRGKVFDVCRAPYRTVGRAERGGMTPGMDLTRVRPPMPVSRGRREILHLGKRESGLPREGFK